MLFECSMDLPANNGLSTITIANLAGWPEVVINEVTGVVLQVNTVSTLEVAVTLVVSITTESTWTSITLDTLAR